MSERIVLEPEEIAGLIRGARLLELRVDTPPETRALLLATAATAMDALCGLSERAGTDAVWDVLALLEHRELWPPTTNGAGWLLAPAVAAFPLANLLDWPWALTGVGVVWALALGGLLAWRFQRG